MARAARRAAESVAGVTVNRLCASGLSAVVAACHAIAAGDGELFVAGGVESMTPRAARLRQARAGRSRAATRRSGTRRSAGASRTRAWRRCSRSSRWARRARTSPSATASRARTRTRSRCESQQRWAAADEAGRFADELVPVGDVARDEHPRPDTSAEKLAALKPAFREGGTVTAGNSSGINDGAAALVIASEERARELGAEPLGAFVGSRGRRRRPARHGHRAGPGRAEAARARRRRRRTSSTWSS